MKIFINALSANNGGGITYLENIFDQISRIKDVNHQYFVLMSSENADKLHIDRKIFKIFIWKKTNPFFTLLQEQFFLPSLLKKLAIDLIFIPTSIDIFWRKCKSVIVLRNIEPFDIHFLTSPGRFIRLRWPILRILTRLSLYSTDKTIAFSNQIKNRAVKEYSLPAKVIAKINVHYPGRSSAFMTRHKLERQQAKAVLRKYNLLNIKYIFSVSSIRRHKNYINLLKAYVIMKKRGQDDNKLVIAGETLEEDYFDEINNFIRDNGLEKDVFLIGKVPYSDLPYLYAYAKCFVMPSFFEAFGHPYVEALAAGIPIAGSNLPIVKEICGQAVKLFDPNSSEDIHHAIIEAINHSDDLIGLAAKKIRSYDDWKQTTRYLLNLFSDMAES